MRALFVAFCLLAVFGLSTASGQGIIFNELYNSGGNDEWLELLVVQDSVDLRGWDFRDFSSTGTPQQPLVFSNHAVWNGLRPGTLIVVARPENTFAEDLDPSDYLLVIKSNNGLFFTGNPFLFAGASDAIQLRTGSGTHVIGVSWGNGNASSIPEPKVHFSGTSSSGTSISFNGDAVAQVTSTSNWTVNNASPTRGAGNNITNAAWITTLRSRANGSGTATISPDTLTGGSTGPIEITYARDTQFNVTDLRIIVPSTFEWSRTPADVNFTNVTGTLSVSGDTVYITDITFTVDTTVITIQNVTAPEFTGHYSFRVQSRQDAYDDVAPLPRIVVFGQPEPIADVKVNDANGVMLRINDLVTIRGIVTVANQFGAVSYLQDNSAGMAIFGSSFANNVAIGDEVIVSGIVQPFNGLSEIVNPILHSIVSSGNTVVPLVVTAAQVANDGQGGVEEYEGLLVRMNGVSVVGSGTWTGNTNYALSDITGLTEIRIANATNLVGQPIPAGAFDMVCVVGQFKNAVPYIGGYQVMPRFTSDIISTGPIFTSFPLETTIEPTHLTISWNTLNNGTSQVFYGTTPSFELGVAGATNPTTSHSVQLDSLLPATVYYIQAFSVAGGDTSKATTLIASTASPEQSTGEINVYFSKSVNTGLAWFRPANSNQNLANRIINRINNSRRSVDAALYSLSGNPGNEIAAALVNARNRGVSVRVIREFDTPSAAYDMLTGNGVPLITDRFDPINNGVGLHHNKFFVIDYRGGAPESVWVSTGSWNPSQPGTFDDYQNVVELQDVALAGAYTLEFNEMWGSGTETPNAANSRFGARKLDNTPHRFMIGGKLVESYFSPSDRTTSKMVNVLNNADHSIGFALLTITRTDLANSILAKKNAGKAVRGLVDNNTDQGSQYNFLLANGVDMRLKQGPGLLHHKYAIVDAENPFWNSVTITGSHNWSNAAENQNNENTLIIRDGDIANQFLQEFAARYYQFGGSDSIFVSVEEIPGDVPLEFSLSQNYPNPFNPTTRIQYAVPSAGRVTLKVYDVIGREVFTLAEGYQSAGTYEADFHAPGLSSGVYFYRLEAGSFVQQRKMLLLK